MTALTRLLASLLLGIPAGFACDVVHQASVHPAFRWLLVNHPLLVLPALAGPAAFAGIGGLSGVGVPGGGDVMRNWMVACASAVQLWSDWE